MLILQLLQDEVQQSQAALKALGAELVEVLPLEWCGQNDQRTAVIVRKCAHMTKEYPRQEGIPKKYPLQ